MEAAGVSWGKGLVRGKEKGTQSNAVDIASLTHFSLFPFLSGVLLMPTGFLFPLVYQTSWLFVLDEEVESDNA